MEKHNFKGKNESAGGEITDSGFSEDTKDGEGSTRLLRKSELLVRSPSYENPTNNQETELYYNAQRRLMAQNEDGNTFLHESIIAEQEGIACKIARVTESMDTLQLKNHFGKTPLVLSVEKGMATLVRLLMDLGVDLNCIEYKNRNNILHIAVKNNDVEMLELFKSFVVKHEILSNLACCVNERGHTPLHSSVIMKSLACCQLLLSFGSQIDAQAYKDGYTCLHFAVLNEDATFLSAFIDKCNPDLEVMSYAGQTAYELATENGFQAGKDILAKAGAITEQWAPDFETVNVNLDSLH